MKAGKYSLDKNEFFVLPSKMVKIKEKRVESGHFTTD